MQLYNFTLQPSSNVTTAVVGQFQGTRQQDILLVRGSRLELYHIDTNTGKMSRALSQNTFGNIRSATCFRLTGSTKGMYFTVLIKRLSDFGQRFRTHRCFGVS